MKEADPQPRGEGETVTRIHLAVLTSGAENLPPAHDQHHRQQDVHRVVETRLRITRQYSTHEEEAVDCAAAAEKLAEEAGHGNLPVLLADERGHDAEAHHEVACVAAEDHVAAGLVGLGEVDEVVEHESDDVGQVDRRGNEPAGGALRSEWSGQKGISVGQTVGVGVGEPCDIEGDGTQDGRDGDQQEASLEKTEVIFLEEQGQRHWDDRDVHEYVAQRGGRHRLQKRDGNILGLVDIAATWRYVWHDVEHVIRNRVLWASTPHRFLSMPACSAQCRFRTPRRTRT